MPNRHDVNPKSVAHSQDLIGRATLVVVILILTVTIISIFGH